MLDDDIYRLTEDIRQKCGSRDPYEIAQSLGIMVRYSNEFKTLCGLYAIIGQKRVIILNDNLSESRRKIILAHEIGHDQLHRDLAENTALQDFMLYDMSARPEYEANMFAADLLLSDEDVWELASCYGYALEQIAAGLNTDTKLVGLKTDSMKRRGYGT